MTYMSLNWVIIGSGNSSSPVYFQDINWTNYNSLLIGPSEKKFSEIQMKMQTTSLKKIHLKENTSKNIVCKIVAILPQPQRCSGHDINWSLKRL